MGHVAYQARRRRVGKCKWPLRLGRILPLWGECPCSRPGAVPGDRSEEAAGRDAVGFCISLNVKLGHTGYYRQRESTIMEERRSGAPVRPPAGSLTGSGEGGGGEDLAAGGDQAGAHEFPGRVPSRASPGAVAAGQPERADGGVVAAWSF